APSSSGGAPISSTGGRSWADADSSKRESRSSRSRPISVIPSRSLSLFMRWGSFLGSPSGSPGKAGTKCRVLQRHGTNSASGTGPARTVRIGARADPAEFDLFVVLVHDFELRVDRRLVLGRTARSSSARSRSARLRARLRRLLLIELGRHSLPRGGELLLGGLDLRHVAGVEHGAEFGDRLLHARFLRRVDLVAALLDRLLDLVGQLLGPVARVDRLASLLVLGSVRLGVAHHPIDLRIAQSGARLDDDALFLAGRLVLRRHLENAVRVDVERDLDLRHSARRGRDSHEVELPERLVVRRHRALTLEHVDLDLGLVVRGGREYLRLARRDGGVALD